MPLLFLDQTETRMAEKKILEAAPPPPPPLYLRVWIGHCSVCVCVSALACARLSVSVEERKKRASSKKSARGFSRIFFFRSVVSTIMEPGYSVFFLLAIFIRLNAADGSKIANKTLPSPHTIRRMRHLFLGL